MGNLHRGKFLNKEELEHLKEVTNDPTCREKVFLRMLISTGARGVEIRNIRFKDCEEDSIYVQGAKGSKSRQLRIDSTIWKGIQNIKNARKASPNDKVFPIHRNTSIKWFRKWSIAQGKSLHSLRHTYAVHMYRRTKNILLVKNLLGHCSIGNTMIYMDYCISMEEQKKHSLI